jgi:hypothetical protein
MTFDLSNDNLLGWPTGPIGKGIYRMDNSGSFNLFYYLHDATLHSCTSHAYEYVLIVIKATVKKYKLFKAYVLYYGHCHIIGDMSFRQHII